MPHRTPDFLPVRRDGGGMPGGNAYYKTGAPAPAARRTLPVRLQHRPHRRIFRRKK